MYNNVSVCCTVHNSSPIEQKPPVSTEEEANLERLMEMGFGLEASLDALRATGNDLEKACGLLVKQPSKPSVAADSSKSQKSGPLRW